MPKMSIKTGPCIVSTAHENVPSWNATYKHWAQKSQVTNEWRTEGKNKCLAALGLDEDDWFLLHCEPLIKHRALVIVNVFLPHEGIQDIHNTNIKPILDGYSDAGLWADDEWAWVPVVMYKFAGITPGSRNITISVYELNSFWIGDNRVTLPEGRTRNDG